EVHTNRPLPWWGFDHRLTVVVGELEVHRHALFARTVLCTGTALLARAAAPFLLVTAGAPLVSARARLVKSRQLLASSTRYKRSCHGNAHRADSLGKSLRHRGQIGGRDTRIWWKAVDLWRVQQQENRACSADAVFVICAVQSCLSLTLAV